jgi:hypothetical protein
MPLNMRRTRQFLLFCSAWLFGAVGYAQTTFPLNDVADPKYLHYAFTNATIVKDATTTITNGTLIIKTEKLPPSAGAEGATGCH